MPPSACSLLEKIHICIVLASALQYRAQGDGGRSGRSGAGPIEPSGLARPTRERLIEGQNHKNIFSLIRLVRPAAIGFLGV
jgi:hypothetical protein